MPNEENNVEYLIEENDFKVKSKKRRKPALLIISIAALILALGSSGQILLYFIDESITISRLQLFFTAVISGGVFLLFLILFLAIRTSEKKDIVTKKDEPKEGNLKTNVEINDGFVDLVEDETYVAVEEEASNKKEELEEIDTFDLTTKILNDRLLTSFHNNSLHCDTSYLCATLSATNLLFINKNDQDVNLILDSISTGLSGRNILIDATKFESCNDLISSEGFLNFVDEAAQDYNKLYFVGLTNISIEKIKDVMSEFLEALFDRNNASRVDINVNGNEETHFIGQNLFFIIFKKDEEKILSLPSKILRYSIVDNLMIKAISFDNVELEKRIISYYDFRRAINNCLSEHYMSENRWEKIDSLSSFLNTKKTFMISNDVLNNMEFFSSVLLSLGTKKDVTFDRVCADILLPSILKDFGRELIVGDEGIYQFVNDNFVSTYTLPKTEALIKDARYLEKEEADKKDNSETPNGVEKQLDDLLDK